MNPKTKYETIGVLIVMVVFLLFLVFNEITRECNRLEPKYRSGGMVYVDSKPLKIKGISDFCGTEVEYYAVGEFCEKLVIKESEIGK